MNAEREAEFDKHIASHDAIFHYTRLPTAIEKILSDGRFRLGQLRDMNDPREYKFKLLGMIGWSLPPEAPDLYDKCHPVIDRIVRHECRIGCFCTNQKGPILSEDRSTLEDPIPSTNGWSKSRMWSQYGENQHGICLVFSRKYLEEELHRHTAEVEWIKCDSVTYSVKERMSVQSLNMDGNRLIKEGVEPYCRSHVEQEAHELFFTKHVDYRDESEYRISAHDPRNAVEYVDIGSSIKGIIAGDRTPEVYFPLLEQFAGKYGIVARHAYWDRGKSHLLLLKKREES
jgi:hypothetical protein